MPTTVPPVQETGHMAMVDVDVEYGGEANEAEDEAYAILWLARAQREQGSKAPPTAESWVTHREHGFTKNPAF